MKSESIFNSKNDQLAIIKALLEAGASVNIRETNEGYTALVYAIEAGNPQVVSLLLAQPGIEVDFQTNENGTPLEIAHRIKNKQITVMLEEKLNNKENKESHDAINKS